jgi:hypothetical protein
MADSVDTAEPTSQGQSRLATKAEADALGHALGRPGVDHKLLGLVVHGIGEQPVGSTVKQVAWEFLPLARGIDQEATIAAKPVDEGDPAEVRIRFHGPNQELYELRFLEVWWAQAFEPPSFGAFLKGLWDFPRTLLGRADRRKGFRFWPERQYWGFAIWQRLLVDVAVFVLLPLLLPLLILVWLVGFLGTERFLPRWLLAGHRLLVNLATRQLGDAWVYFRNPWEASRIRVRFEERFNQVVELLQTDPEKGKTDAVFVIAHSLGSVVAYEALTGRRMTHLIQETFPAEGQPTFHFISVGSALNSAWDFVPDSERFRFYRRFASQVHWLNLWSGPDPVSRGQLRVPDACKIRRPDRFKQRTVLNQMDLFSDHSAYWNNVEQVIAPILDSITSGQLSSALQMNTQAREVRVRKLAALKALVWLVFPAAYFSLLLTGSSEWISGWAEETFLGGETWQRYLLAPALWAGLIAAVAVVVYSTVVKWVWDLFDGKLKYRRIGA